MSAPAMALPATLPDAPALIQQLVWRGRQLEQERFGPSSERQTPEPLSKEPILLSLFPTAAPAATQEALLLKSDDYFSPVLTINNPP